MQSGHACWLPAVHAADATGCRVMQADCAFAVVGTWVLRLAADGRGQSAKRYPGSCRATAAALRKIGRALALQVPELIPGLDEARAETLRAEIRSRAARMLLSPRAFLLPATTRETLRGLSRSPTAAPSAGDAQSAGDVLRAVVACPRAPADLRRLTAEQTKTLEADVAKRFVALRGDGRAAAVVKPDASTDSLFA